MNLLSDVCSHFVNKECCDSILVNFELTNKECILLFISRGVSYGLICFSAILKLPQILQILKNSSGEGLSIFSLFTEIFANVIGYCYHRQKEFPFATFGETILILIQNVFIAFLVTHFDKTYNPIMWISFMMFNLIIMFTVEHHLASNSVILILWTLCLPLSLIYKLLQIAHVWKSECKGELSSLSCFLTMLGSLGRVFTTLNEVKDISILLMYIINVVLNGTILLQSIYYEKKTKKLYD